MSDFGFTMLSPEEEARVDALLDALNNDQVAALRALAEVRKRYYHDIKAFMSGRAAAILASEESEEQMAVDLSVATGDLVLRALTKFTLAAAEIVAFGEPQGDLPMETERIIKIDLDFD